MNAPIRFAAPIRSAGSPSAALVDFDDVGKVFPARRGGTAVTALAGVSLAIDRGEIFGVMGRSGAGKSTLIRLVNGLEKATSGRVVVDGQDIGALEPAGLRPVLRSIGMIFQHFNLLSSRTVFDNVALPLEIAGMRRAAIRGRVEPLLALVGLADKRDRYPAELSGGQKQRVGIARALATQPKMLLCDEATSALDPETTASILTLLADINRDLGVTIMLITHEIHVIKQICRRVAVMEAGRVIEEGPAFDVLTRPRHPTTASFVRNVAGVELPGDLAARIEPFARPGDRAVVRVSYAGRDGRASVLRRLAEGFGLDVEILAGRIDQVGGEPFGALLVALPVADRASLGTLPALAAHGLDAEVIGYVA